MEIVFLDKEKYYEWDKFCLESKDAWFWHTSSWLEYVINLRPYLNPRSKSFIVLLDKKIVAICPIIIEEKEEVKEFSFDGGCCQIPAFGNLSRKLKENVEKKIFEEIDKIAKKEGVKRVSLKYSPLANYFISSKIPLSNSLLKFGYLDISWNTQIIDLSKSLEELRRDVRHGHDAAIDSASKEFEVEIFDKDNITKKDFDDYCEMHHKAAGRITRPQVTFDMMYDWIKNGNGFLIGAKKDKKFVGFSLFICYKKGVYYGSAANDPEVKGSIGHLILWEGIKYAKEKGFSYFDMGYQEYPSLNKIPSEKELEIAKFKRGFGGFSKTLFAGEKYYDKEYFLDSYHNKVNKYAETIEENG